MGGWACGEQAHGGDAGVGNGSLTQEGTAKGNGGRRGGRESGSGEKNANMFRRVVAEEWLGKKGAWDNSYTATFGDSGWGAKAEAVLGTVSSLCCPVPLETPVPASSPLVGTRVSSCWSSSVMQGKITAIWPIVCVWGGVLYECACVCMCVCGR